MKEKQEAARRLDTVEELFIHKGNKTMDSVAYNDNKN